MKNKKLYILIASVLILLTILTSCSSIIKPALANEYAAALSKITFEDKNKVSWYNGADFSISGLWVLEWSGEYKFIENNTKIQVTHTSILGGEVTEEWKITVKDNKVTGISIEKLGITTVFKEK
jgi:hypothetical protein